MKDKVNIKFKLIFLILLSLLFGCLTTENVSAEKKNIQDETLLYIENIIDWKKSSIEINSHSSLFNNEFLQDAGETSGDWFAFGIGRSGYPDEYDNYLAVIEDVVEKRYQRPEQLSNSKATEWHRISLAILAMGGDPTQVGLDKNTEPINLIADGTYNRGLTELLGKQGINGWIWGLITLDSMRYEVPKDAQNTREEIIEEILKSQLADGGFALDGIESDPDMTGMAIQALAPYYNSEEIYAYEQRAIKENVTKSVRTVVDGALGFLSEAQREDGDFTSWGSPNLESTAQVVVALTSLGIDPLEDERFIKEGNTLVDGLLKYLMADGGFIHSEIYDSENPTSSPQDSNTMASEQALYAFIALNRNANDYRTLYDFREEMSLELKEKINALMETIETIPEEPSRSDHALVEETFQTYLTIPVEERSYVFNYYKLADAMEELEIKNTSEPLAETMGINSEGAGTILSLFDGESAKIEDDVFTQKDASTVDALPDEVTTEYYVEVVKLITRLEEAENREEYEYLLDILYKKQKEIEKIEEEIVSINQAIIQNLYPFEEIGIEDKENVEMVMNRYKNLSSYDQSRVQGYADVEKANTQINNLIRARYITIGIGLLVVILAVVLIIRRNKRKTAKAKEKMTFDD